jgi:hypothetical protein
MTDTLREILDTTRQFVQTKEAEYKSTVKEADKALETAGAGDDSPITRGHALGAEEAALEPHKEPAVTSDANAEPNAKGGKTTGSAEGENEGNETDRSDKLESEDAVASPSKEPAISGDAMAEPKSAADAPAVLANEILASINAAKQASAEGKAEEVEATDSKEASADDAESVEKAAKDYYCDECKAEGKEDCKCDMKADKEDKEASGPQLELTNDVLAKIAAMVLSTDDGAEFVEGVMAKAAGAEAAQETLNFLAEQSELAEKQAAYEAGQADAQALIEQAIYDAGIAEGQKQAASQPAEGDQLLGKLAELIQSGNPQEQAEAVSLYEKLGQAVADASIEDLMGAADAGGAPMDVAPEELAVGGEEMGGEEMGEEGITEEELQAALESLIADGTLGEDEVAQILDYIASAEEGGEAEAGAGIEEGAEVAPEVAPEELAGGEGMEAQASDASAALLAQIRKIKAQG